MFPYLGRAHGESWIELAILIFHDQVCLQTFRPEAPWNIYTGVISQCHQQWVSKGSVGMCIPIIGRVITIWDEVLFKFRLYFYGMVRRKKVFLESSHRIDTHNDVVVEVLEVQSSVIFTFCLDEDFIEFWWADIMFEIPHATNFGGISTFQWWILIVIRDQSGRILRIWLILLVWWVFIKFGRGSSWSLVTVLIHIMM